MFVRSIHFGQTGDRPLETLKCFVFVKRSKKHCFDFLEPIVGGPLMTERRFCGGGYRQRKFPADPVDARHHGSSNRLCKASIVLPRY